MEILSGDTSAARQQRREHLATAVDVILGPRQVRSRDGRAGVLTSEGSEYVSCEVADVPTPYSGTNRRNAFAISRVDEVGARVGGMFDHGLAVVRIGRAVAGPDASGIVVDRGIEVVRGRIGRGVEPTTAYAADCRRRGDSDSVAEGIVAIRLSVGAPLHATVAEAAGRVVVVPVRADRLDVARRVVRERHIVGPVDTARGRQRMRVVVASPC